MRAELLHLALFLGIGAHHPHAGEALLHARRDVGEALLDLGEQCVDALAEELGGERHQRHGHESEQGEAAVDPRHEEERAGGGEEGVGAVHDRRAAEHADRLEVVGRPRHQVAGGVVWKKPGGCFSRWPK